MTGPDANEPSPRTFSTASKNNPSGGSRSEHVLEALARATSVMTGGAPREEVFGIVGSTLRRFDLSTVVLLLDDAEEELFIAYLSNSSRLVEQAEALAGFRRDQFRFRPETTDFHRRVVRDGETVFMEDTTEAMRQILPQVPASAIRLVCKLLRFQSTIGAPLLDGDHIIGMLVVSSGLLVPADHSAVRLFATQLGATLRLRRLDDELQRKARELEATRTQLLAAQRREVIGVLAGCVAHDFNNLLNAISLSAELIDAAEEGVDTSADLDVIRASCDRGGNLVQQLLSLGHRRELEPTTFDTDGMVGQLENLLDRVLGEDIHVVVERGRGSKLVLGDLSQLEQVLINLAINARHAMPHGGELTLATAIREPDELPEELPPGRYVELRVRDEGVGMDAETQARAFEAFFTTRPRGRGTGLGLSVAKTIVEQHLGWMGVQSEPGRGTEFTILLPRARAARAAQGPRAAAATVAPAEGDGRVALVIEDDPLVRRTCGRLLERGGWRVRTAENGNAARAVVAEVGDTIDVILCDIVLAFENGPKLVEELIGQLPRAAVVMTSGCLDERADRDRITEHGWRFLAKPFTRDDLLKAMDEVARGSR